MTTATATKTTRTLRWIANTDECSPTAGCLLITINDNLKGYVVVEYPTGTVGTRGFSLSQIGGGEGYSVTCGTRGDSCECPDALYRKRACKHTAAVRKLLDMGKI